MKTGIISSSQIMKHDRLDPQFHLTIDALSDEIKDLANRYSPEDALTLLKEVDLPLDKLSFLRDIARSNSGTGTFDEREFLKVAQDYPIESLALVISHSDAIYQQVKQARDEAASKADASLNSLSSFKNM